MDRIRNFLQGGRSPLGSCALDTSTAVGRTHFIFLKDCFFDIAVWNSKTFCNLSLSLSKMGSPETLSYASDTGSEEQYVANYTCNYSQASEHTNHRADPPLS